MPGPSGADDESVIPDNLLGHDDHRLVLIADDEPDIRDLVALRLERSGFTVECVQDGTSALAFARERRPAVAVLDIAMPGMSGLEVLQALKEDPATAHIPVVLLTARATPADVERGLELGADDYLTKPFSPQELAAKLQAQLDRAAATAAVYS